MRELEEPIRFAIHAAPCSKRRCALSVERLQSRQEKPTSGPFGEFRGLLDRECFDRGEIQNLAPFRCERAKLLPVQDRVQASNIGERPIAQCEL